MSRVITAIAFDLSMIVRPGWSPPCGVAFVDTDADGHESPGRVTFIDADALTMWTATDKIAAANTLLDARAAALPDLPTIAARMTAVDDLDRQLREKQAALAAADEQLAARATALAAEAPVAVAAPMVSS